MTRTEVIKIDGAPGVGKSYKLREYVEREARGGVALDDMYYLTFTRSGREDTVAELGEAFPDADEDELEDRSRTVHGAAWLACAQHDFWADADDVNQVIQRGSDDDFYSDFASLHGMRYEGESNTLRKVTEGKETEGTADKLFAINDWLTLTRRPVSDFHCAPVGISLPREEVETLLEAWGEYKRAGRDGVPVYEHGDYVDAAIDNEYVPDVRVLFIDEFQDLSPQEYLLYKKWRDSGYLDRIYIAGDPNQSIYSFRAGTPVYFEETEVDECEELKESWRCPSAVASVARGILESCSETDSKGFAARESGGFVKSVNADPDQTFADFVLNLADEFAASDGVMLLARANYQVKHIARTLRNYGVPYEYLGSHNSIWRDEMVAMLSALRAMKTGTGGVRKDVAKKLIKAAPKPKERLSRLDDSLGTVYDSDELREVFDDYERVEHIPRSLQLSNSYRNELLESAVKQSSGARPESVRVGTIHAAKGLEADAVLLFDGYTSNLDEQYTRGEIRPEEHRLYYVGATRASERLYVVRDFFDGPSAPALPNPLPESWRCEA